RNLAKSLAGGNRDVFQSLFSTVVSEVTTAWSIPRDISGPFSLSFERVAELQRATRATVMCVVLNGEHPLVLMSRASKGDRLSILDLLKADKMFMHDRCCAATIRNAELQEDWKFL